MADVPLAALRARLHESFATTHTGFGGVQASAYIYRRDIRPEQVAAAHARGIPTVVQGDYHDLLAEHPGDLGAVIATDVLEHQRRVGIVHGNIVTQNMAFVAAAPRPVEPKSASPSVA